MRDQQLEKFQHRTSETTERELQTSHGAGSFTAELQAPHHPSSELNLEVDVLPSQFTYPWEYSVGLDEPSKSPVVSQSNSSQLIDDANEFAGLRSEDAERSNYQSQPFHILPESEVASAGHNNGYTPLRRPNDDNTSTTTSVLQRTSTPAYVYNSTTTRANRKQSSGKGLDLAETQYFSDLPSKQQVSSLFQNGEYIRGRRFST